MKYSVEFKNNDTLSIGISSKKQQPYSLK